MFRRNRRRKEYIPISRVLLDLHTEERVNRYMLILGWGIILVAAVVQALTVSDFSRTIAILLLGGMYLIPTILYVIRRNSPFIKYAIFACVIIVSYGLMFHQKGSFDNVFFLIITVVLTSVYFDVLFTIVASATLLTISILLFALMRQSLFNQFSLEQFISMLIAFLSVTVVVILQNTISRELVNRNRELFENAVKDRMTGIYNRAHIDQMLYATLKSNEGNADPAVGLLIMDVDDFKAINDRYGHPEGDRVLTDLVKAVLAVSRREDIFARYGGEEFALLMNGCTHYDLGAVAEKIRSAVENEVSCDGRPVTVSIGGTCLRADDSVLALVARADEALYQSKRKGKNRFTAR